MPIKLGNTEINKIYLGSTEIKKAYLGSNLIFDNSIPQYFLRFSGTSKDRILIPENWGTQSNFNVEFNVEEFNDTAGTTYILMKHGNDFRPDPSFRLGIVGGVVQLFIRNTGGTIETVTSAALSLPFTGIIKVESNSLWVNNDEYPITYNMDTTWNDEVSTFVCINNNLTGAFTGDINSLKTPIDSYLLNEGVGATVTGELLNTGTITTDNAGGNTYIDTMWKQ